jgi:hypothetical protein
MWYKNTVLRRYNEDHNLQEHNQPSKIISISILYQKYHNNQRTTLDGFISIEQTYDIWITGLRFQL